MRQRPLMTIALLSALLTAACAQQSPMSPLEANARQAGGSQAAAIAGQEALREMLGEDAPVTQAASGLDASAFRSFDRDADGRLSRREQTEVFQQVWKAMLEVYSTAPARSGDDVDTSATYSVPHSFSLAPTQAELFIDAGEILPAVYQTIQSAKHSIHLDLFLLGGAEGRKLAELLARKAQEGVEVRLIHDPGFGLAGTTKDQVIHAVSFLQAQGVAVKSYPLKYLKRRKGHPLANKFQIDHNKFIVVDEEIAMIGSMNLIDIGTMNHDVYMRLTGEPARELASIHNATWALKGPKTPDLRRETREPATAKAFGLLNAQSMARVTKTDIDQQTTKKALIEGIKSAKKSVHLAIFEFGDLDVVEALIGAYKRGLDVRVLADKNAQYAKYLPIFAKLKLYGTPNLLTMNRLREAGVPVKWYIPQTEDQELHMKTAMIDGERAFVGSTNFTYQAFNTFRETSVEVVGGPVPTRMEAMFEKDWATRGEPVTKPDFKEKAIATAVKYMDKFNLSWW